MRPVPVRQPRHAVRLRAAHPPATPSAVWGLLAVLAALLATLTACGDASGDDDGGGGVTLTVLAASSLTDVFEEVGSAYESGHPGVRLSLSFAGSQELASQVRQGVPADVLVTADTETMESVAAETDRAPVVIARNELTIVTPAGNPGGVSELSDLADPGLRVVLAAPEVPAGGYAAQLLDARGVDVSPVSEEPTVRAVLSKVQLGEADAGIVYVTDATVAGDAVETVPIPRAGEVTATYPAASLASSAHPEQARAFVEWLTGGQARSLLRDAGFVAP
ncbi:molybdate ABC transporter substrate-binding protein [Streptomyces sp. 4N509B]|uniref:molybdate ABC transporter substrate-binding protein n=1 Tax=Streptomyces sp. 4N509B TaxID=3457413 RepID=UPI003FD29E8F